MRSRDGFPLQCYMCFLEIEKTGITTCLLINRCFQSGSKSLQTGDWEAKVAHVLLTCYPDVIMA